MLKSLNCKNPNRPRYRTEAMPYAWEVRKPLEFYLEHVQPLVKTFGTQPETGIHGVDTHTLSVVFRGIDYALSIGKTGNEIIPVVFACAFHDMARTNDGADITHGRNAEPMAKEIMDKFPDLLDKNTRTNILYAIRLHSIFTGPALEYISACLWDADRTRMAWKYGFDEKFFNTQRGKYVAQHYQKYLEFQRRLFSGFDWSKQY